MNRYSACISFNSILQLTTDGECLKDQIVQSAEFPLHAIRRLVEIHTSMTVAPGFAQTMCAREICHQRMLAIWEESTHTQTIPMYTNDDL